MMATERLYLRSMRLHDDAFLFQLMNEPGWLEHIGDRKITDVAAARKYIEEKVQPVDAIDGCGACVVELKSTGEAIGVCGLYKRPDLPEPDLGFAFLEAHWGRGLAREAAQAIVEQAKEEGLFSQLLAIVTETNEPSIRLLTHLGFQKGGTYSCDGEELLLMKLALSTA